MSRAINFFTSRIKSYHDKYSQDITPDSYFGFPIEPVLNAENQLFSGDKNIAYLSMEYGLSSSFYNTFQSNTILNQNNITSPVAVFSNYKSNDLAVQIALNRMVDLPIFSGGLGVLAGDVIKSAADLKLPFVGVGILWNKGYFKQKISLDHGQIAEEFHWEPANYPGLLPLKDKISIDTKYGPLDIGLWKYYVYSFDRQHVCPLILLDTNVTQHNGSFRPITDLLYRSDGHWWKVCQRAVLGLGAVKALEHLGYRIARYHLNEGHAALAYVQKFMDDKENGEVLNKKFVYTCHTPVEAGHDRFHINELQDLFTEEQMNVIKRFGVEKDNPEIINLTRMCLNACQHVNGVSQKHGEVTRLQFPNYASKIDAITNGVHCHTWLSKSVSDLLNRNHSVFAGWSQNAESLKAIVNLKNDETFRKELFAAHQINKRALFDLISHWELDENVLTIGWARRFAGYKRPQLIFEDIDRLQSIANSSGALQIIFAGKAHPNDNIGAARINDILRAINKLAHNHQNIKVILIENYDTYFGKMLTAGVDVWLNNPLPPFEASGTSGMKAILNGVLQLSTLDGSVIEAVNDDIGWIFGTQHKGENIGSEHHLQLQEDAQSLYETLDKVAGLYYATNNKGNVTVHSAWIDKMINCIRTSAFFTTDRMVKEYVKLMWNL